MEIFFRLFQLKVFQFEYNNNFTAIVDISRYFYIPNLTFYKPSTYYEIYSNFCTAVAVSDSREPEMTKTGLTQQHSTFNIRGKAEIGEK